MSLSEIILVASGVVMLLSIITTIGVAIRIKRFKDTKDKPVINSQREILENRIYTIQQQLLDDSYNFVDTNKLLIKFASDNKFSNNIPNYSFFDSLGISISHLQQSENTAFCLMPFNKQYWPLYIIIKQACGDKGIICSRSDETYEPGNILKQILESIIRSRFIFAVLDGRNPNVFYEIGIAHAIGKPVFLIAHQKDKDKLPFDVSSSRLILYKSYNHLERQIQEIIDNNKVENGHTGENENS